MNRFELFYLANKALAGSRAVVKLVFKFRLLVTLEIHHRVETYLEARIAFVQGLVVSDLLTELKRLGFQLRNEQIFPIILVYKLVDMGH